MKKGAIILILSIFWGCGPQRSYQKIKRHWYKIQAELQKYPQLVDSLEIVDHDTIFIEGVHDTIWVKANDPNTWDDSFKEKVDSAAFQLVNTSKLPTVEYVNAAQNLQKVICPKIEKDTTFFVTISNSRINYKIPINVGIKALGGKLLVIVNTSKVEIPDDTINTEISFKCPPTPFYKNPWFWGFFGLLVLLIVLMLWRLLK